jgi:penicillin-binding protein 1A
MPGCNAPDWDGKPMPRPPSRTRQLINPMAAFQMVHIMEGVIKRGTAVILRDLNRPLYGKTGTTSGPTNVWFIGGTPDIVAGVYVGYDQPKPLGGVQGATVAAPIWKQWAQTALADQPKVPFVAPPGIRWVRIDRMSGKPVFGTFPDESDPKAAVIWEAFQPQTEGPRTYHRHNPNDQNSPQSDQTQAAVAVEQRQPSQPSFQAPAPVTQGPPPALPTQNAVQ